MPHPTSISQVASTAALDGDQGCIDEMLKSFKARHDMVVKGLNAIDGITCLQGDGTFYAFADMRGLMSRIDGIETDVQLAEYLIEKTGIALVPGSAFGSEGYMRLSFATSDANLKAALERLANI